MESCDWLFEQWNHPRVTYPCISKQRLSTHSDRFSDDKPVYWWVNKLCCTYSTRTGYRSRDAIPQSEGSTATLHALVHKRFATLPAYSLHTDLSIVHPLCILPCKYTIYFGLIRSQKLDWILIDATCVRSANQAVHFSFCLFLMCLWLVQTQSDQRSTAEHATHWSDEMWKDSREIQSQ